MIFKNFLTFWVNSDLIQTKPEKSDQTAHTATLSLYERNALMVVPRKIYIERTTSQ